MAISSYPYVDQPTSDVEYSRLFRELQDNGAAGSYADTTVQAYANSTGLNTFVRAGSAIVRGYYFYNTSDITPTHAGGASNPRIDRIILRLDLTQAIGSRIVAAVLPGTPAASPVAPTLTQTDTGIYEISLAQVAIAANAVTIAAGNVTDERSFVGARTGVWSALTRPTTARRGKLGLNISTGRWEQYGASGWTDMAIDGTQITSGLLPAARLPAHSAALLTSGTLDNARLVNIPYTKIASVDSADIDNYSGSLDPAVYGSNTIRQKNLTVNSWYQLDANLANNVRSGSYPISPGGVTGSYTVLSQVDVSFFVFGPMVYVTGVISFVATGNAAAYWSSNDGVITTVGGTGNITNMTIGTAAYTANLYPVRQAALSAAATGGLLGAYIDSNGVFGIGSSAPNTDITISTSWSFSGFYLRSGNTPLGS